MIQARLSTVPQTRTEKTYDAEWAHQEAKRLLAKKAPPEYLFEEERSENIHLYERTIINHPMNHGDTISGI
jgi:hypothetical protein